VKSTHLLSLVFCSITLLIPGCGSSSSVPCPSDQYLIDHFTLHELEFEKLIIDPVDAAQLSTLNIQRYFRSSPEQTQIWWFHVWVKDFVGLGGCAKGYAYCEEPPGSLVDDIDINTQPGAPENKDIYRHIKGKWYLFYQSNN